MTFCGRDGHDNMRLKLAGRGKDKREEKVCTQSTLFSRSHDLWVSRKYMLELEKVMNWGRGVGRRSENEGLLTKSEIKAGGGCVCRARLL